jgi:hypothetical protein
VLGRVILRAAEEKIDRIARATLELDHLARPQRAAGVLTQQPGALPTSRVFPFVFGSSATAWFVAALVSRSPL